MSKDADSLAPTVKHWRSEGKRFGRPDAFWLPTASGKFYPDLRRRTDRWPDPTRAGIQGAHLTKSADTARARIGALWEKASSGKVCS